MENVLFGPHDCSHTPSDGYPLIPTDGNEEAPGTSCGGGATRRAAPSAWPALTPLPVGPAPQKKQEGLLSAQEDEETLPDIRCLVATAVITLFNVSDTIWDVTQTGGMCWLYQTGGRLPEVEASGSGGGREAYWPDGVCCPDEEVCEGWWRVLCAA